MLPTEVVTRYGAWLQNTDRRIANDDWQRTVLKYCVLLNGTCFDFYRYYWETLKNYSFMQIRHQICLKVQRNIEYSNSTHLDGMEHGVPYSKSVD